MILSGPKWVWMSQNRFVLPMQLAGPVAKLFEALNNSFCKVDSVLFIW